MNNDLISRSELKKAFNKWWGCDDIPATVVEDLIDNAQTVEPKTDILEQIISEINTSNRGTCDYYIVDRIEEIINEYQKGGAE